MKKCIRMRITVSKIVIWRDESSLHFTASLTCLYKTKFPTVKPTNLPIWQLWRQLSPKYVASSTKTSLTFEFIFIQMYIARAYADSQFLSQQLRSLVVRWIKYHHWALRSDFIHVFPWRRHRITWMLRTESKRFSRLFNFDAWRYQSTVLWCEKLTYSK